MRNANADAIQTGLQLPVHPHLVPSHPHPHRSVHAASLSHRQTWFSGRCYWQRFSAFTDERHGTITSTSKPQHYANMRGATWKRDGDSNFELCRPHGPRGWKSFLEIVIEWLPKEKPINRTDAINEEYRTRTTKNEYDSRAVTRSPAIIASLAMQYFEEEKERRSPLGSDDTMAVVCPRPDWKASELMII